MHLQMERTLILRIVAQHVETHGMLEEGTLVCKDIRIIYIPQLQWAVRYLEWIVNEVHFLRATHQFCIGKQQYISSHRAICMMKLIDTLQNDAFSSSYGAIMDWVR